MLKSSLAVGTSERIHILHVVRRAEGGIAAHVSDLFAGIDSDRFAQSLAGPKEVYASLPPASPICGFLAIDIGDRLGPETLIQAMRIAGQARKLRADIIHAHGYKAAVPAVIAAKLSGRRSIVTGHNMFPSQASGAAKASIRVVSRLADGFIAVSGALAKSLAAAGVSRHKVTVIPSGVDIERCRGGDRAAGRAAMGIEGDAPVVLCVARLTEVKGVEVLIRAADAVARACGEVRVIIVGDGPDRAELEALAGDVAPGMIAFLGFRDDVPDLIAGADVVAVPSLAEGYGLMAVEAMAAGKAVVASDVGGLADNIRNGETGVLVAPGDPEALAAAIARLIREPKLRGTLGAAAAQYASREFTMDLMIARLEEVYQCAVS